MANNTSIQPQLFKLARTYESLVKEGESKRKSELDSSIWELVKGVYNALENRTVPLSFDERILLEKVTRIGTIGGVVSRGTKRRKIDKSADNKKEAYRLIANLFKKSLFARISTVIEVNILQFLTHDELGCVAGTCIGGNYVASLPALWQRQFHDVGLVEYEDRMDTFKTLYIQSQARVLAHIYGRLMGKQELDDKLMKYYTRCRNHVLKISHSKTLSKRLAGTDLLNLSACQLTSFPTDSLSRLWRKMPKLIVLNLADNQLRVLPQSFSQVKLQIFNGSNNCFTQLPAISLSKIQALSLAGNKLTGFPITILTASCLNTLDLSHNTNLGSLPEENWPKSLKTLNVSNCGLKTIPDSVWKIKLRYLNFSNNKITVISGECFCHDHRGIDARVNPLDEQSIAYLKHKQWIGANVLMGHITLRKDTKKSIC